jgi:hypothetical protein
MRTRPTLLLRAIAIGALSIAACTPSTTIEQAWMAPSAPAQPRLQKVVTMFASNNLTMRHAGEDRMAIDLAAKGVQATPSYMIFGDEKLVDMPSVRTRLRDMGYDGIVTMRIVDRQQAIDYAYAPGTFDGYWGAWGPYWAGYDGYYGAFTYEIYRLETAAYSLRTNQLVWSALTKTVDPQSARKLLGDTSQVVATQLSQHGLAG